MGEEGIQFDLGGVAAPGAVPLAHVAPLSLGPLRIEPAVRSVRAGDGRLEQLEPLVMQVLLALASADGATLTRDDLIAACWDGRIVSDDAINRVISKLRRTLDDLAGGEVRLETVPKVGYRLVAPVSFKAPAPLSSAATPRFWRRPALVASGAAALAVAVALSLALLPRAEAAQTIGVEPATSNSGDPIARRLASDVTTDLARLAGAISRVNVVDQADSGGRPPDFVVRIEVERDADRLDANARLVSGVDGSVLWSQTFSEDAGNLARLRERVALDTAAVMRCGLERTAGEMRETTGQRLYFAACDALQADDRLRAYSYARQIVARYPKLGGGWACLAMTSLMAAEEVQQKGGSGATLRRQAVTYARRALALDPAVGRAYIALAAAEGPDNPGALALLERGIAADPEMPSLYRFYSQALFNLGLVRDSVAPALRALALDPASRHSHELAVRRLASAGRIDEALAVQARAERLWPDNPEVRTHRLWLLPYYSDAKAALALLETSGGEEATLPTLPALVASVVRWRAEPARLDLARLDAQAERDFRRAPINAWFMVWAMHAMDQDRRAFAWLDRAPKREAAFQWSILFTPAARELRRDPRFFAAMAELGLVDAWRVSGRWPDFCGEPGLRYDCKAEAARLAAGQPTASRS
jgi:DNA-binding winged helix-turn-helix (wHTH) protein/TolB-like protein/tetratricopeptide (TPR) repeat protein